MNVVYKNVDLAMKYDPATEERPRFTLNVMPPPKNIGFDENKPIAVARAHKKTHAKDNVPTRKQIEGYVPAGFRETDSPSKK